MKKSTALTLTALSLIAATSTFAADAKENWDQHCAKCHAADGSGSTKMGKKLKAKDYTDAKFQAEFTDEQLFKVTAEGSIVDGKERMKGYKDDLSTEDITALVAYIRTMKK